MSNILSIMKGFLTKILPELKSALPILLAVIFVLVNVAIWWAGPWLEIEEQKPFASVAARAIFSTIFSLSCFTLWGVLQWRKVKAYAAQEIKEQQLIEDPIQGIVERQEVELNQVMAHLKQSLNKRNYLYTLPWFLVLGLENAGKTSLINRSGQQFMFSTTRRSAGRKSKNPFSFDWWVGRDAVLIDPDGELLTQRQTQVEGSGEMERRLWLHFVQWLEKTRNRRPLNGVVLAIDVADMVSGTVSDRKAYGQLIRTRLRELMETLSTRLPVYISLTKLDLLQGFEPFFRHYTQSQRDEILGFTFSLNSVDNLDSWLEEFDADFAVFIERINACLPRALLQCRDVEERAEIYSFSRQIAGAHGVLRNFFNEALASDQFSTSALVRGVYFTSVYQEGVPTNAYVDSASRKYGLTETINSAQKSENSTAFFTQPLFKRIIYPEAGLASDNFKVAKQKRRLMALSFVACSIASVLLVGSWHRYYLQNNKQADAVLSKVNSFNEQYHQFSFDEVAKSIVPPLNTIRSATLEFGFFHEKPRYVSDLGLYQGHVIGPKVEETYLNLLAYRYIPALLKQVATDMLNASKASDEKLSLLRVFRMMVDQSGRQNKFVTDYFASRWQQAYEGDRELQAQLMAHLDYALEHTNLEAMRQAGNEEAIDAISPYDGLIARTQQELSHLPIEQRVYRNLKQTASSELGGPLDLKLSTGPAFELVFSDRDITGNAESLNVPRLLTKQGFKGYFIPKSDSVSELALIDSWVLGQSQSSDFSAEDKKVLRNKIRDQYISDYNSTWRSALNQFDIKAFEDINHGVFVLDTISSGSKPISRILNTLSNNTELFPTLPDDDNAKVALMATPEYKIAALIDANFAKLNQLEKVDGTQPNYMAEVMDSVTQLHGYLKAIQDAPDVGKAALQAAQERLTLNDADPIFALKRIASNLPKPMDSIMVKLANESWKVVLQSAIKHLEVRWHNDIYLEYQQKLASRYPFNTETTKQVSLADFEHFFGPEGTINVFYEQQMKMFIEENINTLKQFAQTEDGNDGAKSGLIRQEVMDSLKQAKQIQQAFFNRQGNLDVQFTMEALQMSPNKRRSVINIDGQYVEYSHGPQRSVELVWPNTLRKSAESKLTLVPSAANQSPRSLAYDGPWAFFRLLDTARMTGSSSTSIDYQFSIDQGDVTYRLHTRDTANPFTSRLLSDYSIPETLY
ncbi:type VI secretion system membrane subunit TssM [uncultured Shewanella sp.]|uniref:type VI secretion system membrane subunit TssM n=1 Tax=uncultured Shewanella sp. TaxID=173975 RepID=UPI002622DAE5|nr:type VI secretion system membrane subunit TssM [uncultured Shewanella sp.]